MSTSKPARARTDTIKASFRDPAGFVFRNQKGEVFRQVNKVGQTDYDLLVSSGLYDFLTKQKLLVNHETVTDPRPTGQKGYIVIKPQVIPFISYPFEWSFSQLKDAALLTLRIQKVALKHGITLKDASAYNIQFLNGRPIFIDTLSFEKYQAGTPWQAYRQFCQHFLAPLALMSYTDLDLSQLLRVYIDGIPLGLTTKLLPRKAKLRLGIAMHLIAHNRAQQAKATEHKTQTRTVPLTSLLGIIESLERNISKLKAPRVATEWGDYYDKTNYSTNAADEKARLIKQWVKPLGAKTALDLGGNNGRYSRVLNELHILTVCTDIDPNAVESNYRLTTQHGEQLMLPLVVDLINPGGALGWANHERASIDERLQTDVTIALALIHHLAISNNLPLDYLAEYFSRFSPYLLLEFVPKTDSQVKKLLSTRQDIFPEYNEKGLQKAFASYYKLVKTTKIKGSERTLYLFKKK